MLRFYMALKKAVGALAQADCYINPDYLKLLPSHQSPKAEFLVQMRKS